MDLNFKYDDTAALSPLLIVLCGALSLLLIETFFSELSKKFSSWIAFFFLFAALCATIFSPVSENPMLTQWLKFDHLGKLFSILFLLIGCASICLASGSFDRFEMHSTGEYYFLLLASIFGLMLVGNAADFLTLFLGIETLSISLYVLCGYMKHWKIAQEASLKYFLMGSLAAAFLVYGIALIYGSIGSTQFDMLWVGNQGSKESSSSFLFLAGMGFVMAGLAFKAAVVPFHIWAPDVYAGALTPVTAFMAVGTKAGAFAGLVRVFFEVVPKMSIFIWDHVWIVLIISTLVFSNFLALRQTRLRRLFAYSGISHAGFLLIPFLIGIKIALAPLLFYLIVYAVATFGCFAILVILDHSMEGASLSDLKGLFHRSPFLAGVFALCILTLAGVPPSVGFLAKFYVFKVAFQEGYHFLVIVALITSVLSAFYYFRLISALFSDQKDHKDLETISLPVIGIGVFASLIIITLSIYPEFLLSYLELVQKL